jgi:hypothetical protein
LFFPDLFCSFCNLLGALKNRSINNIFDRSTFCTAACSELGKYICSSASFSPFCSFFLFIICFCLIVFCCLFNFLLVHYNSVQFCVVCILYYPQFVLFCSNKKKKRRDFLFYFCSWPCKFRIFDRSNKSSIDRPLHSIDRPQLSRQLLDKISSRNFVPTCKYSYFYFSCYLCLHFC